LIPTLHVLPSDPSQEGRVEKLELDLPEYRRRERYGIREEGYMFIRDLASYIVESNLLLPSHIIETTQTKS
jgi:hypothetical protein